MRLIGKPTLPARQRQGWKDCLTLYSIAALQRDAAREEALLSREELKKLPEDVESGALVPRAAVTAAEAAAASAASAAATAAATSAFANAPPVAAAPPSQVQDPGDTSLPGCICWCVYMPRA